MMKWVDLICSDPNPETSGQDGAQTGEGGGTVERACTCTGLRITGHQAIMSAQLTAREADLLQREEAVKEAQRYVDPDLADCAAHLRTLVLLGIEQAAYLRALAADLPHFADAINTQEYVGLAWAEAEAARAERVKLDGDE